MGCGASDLIGTSASGLEFVVVGGNKAEYGIDEHYTDIAIFPIENAKLCRYISLPCHPGSGRSMTHGFATSFNPKTSTIYLSGGFYGKGESCCSDSFWAVDVRPHVQIIHESCHSHRFSSSIDVNRIRSLPSMPRAMSGHRMCFTEHGKLDFVYVVGSINQVYRFNAKKNKWSKLPNMPIDIHNLDSITIINQFLFVSGDCKLTCLNLANGEWIIKYRKGFPVGRCVNVGQLMFIHSHNVGDGTVYIYDYRKNRLRKRIQIGDNELLLGSGMAAIGNTIFFTGGFDEILQQTTTSIIQVESSFKQPLVAGFMTQPRENHAVYINEPFRSFRKSSYSK